MEELGRYLRESLTRGIIDHSLRASIDEKSGGVKFYIHPEGKDGETLDVIIPPSPFMPN